MLQSLTVLLLEGNRNAQLLASLLVTKALPDATICEFPATVPVEKDAIDPSVALIIVCPRSENREVSFVRSLRAAGVATPVVVLTSADERKTWERAGANAVFSPRSLTEGLRSLRRLLKTQELEQPALA